jgi:hypothetical protein
MVLASFNHMDLGNPSSDFSNHVDIDNLQLEYPIDESNVDDSCSSPTD